MVFIGNAISAWYVLALHENPPVSWADPFYLSDSLLTLTALLSFPLARRTRLERWKFVLDAAMVLVGGGVAIWYFSVRPTAASQESSVVVTLLAFAYPLVSMLVLLGVTTVLLRRPIDGNRLAFGLLVTGVVGRRRRATSRSTWCSSRPADGARAGPTRVFLVCYCMLIASAELLLAPPGAAAGPRRPVPSTPVPADQSPALPRRRHHLRAAPAGGAPAVDRSGERARHRRAAGHRAGRDPPAPHGARERAAPGRDRRPPERGAVPLAGAALVRRHPGDPDRRHDPVREPVGHAGVRLRSGGDDPAAGARPAAPRGSRAGRDLLPGRRHGARASRARSSGASASRTARGSTPRSWRPTCCTTRRSRASCSTPAT